MSTSLPTEPPRRGGGPPTSMRLGAGLSLLVAALLLWVLVPDGTLTAQGMTELLTPLRMRWWGPLLTSVAMAVLLMLFVPMTPLVAALVFAHGPLLGLFAGVAGVVLSAGLGHLTGRYVLHDMLGQRLAKSLPSIADHLTRRSLRATVAIRLMPGAPFALMNLLAGSAGVPLRYFVAGTALCAVPIVAIMVFIAEGVLRALQSTDPVKAAWWLLGGLALIAVVVGGLRWLRRQR